MPKDTQSICDAAYDPGNALSGDFDVVCWRTMRLISMVVSLTLLLASCNLQKPTAEPKETATLDFQRFVPLPSSTPLVDGVQAGNLALDTKTGRLCKSWEWLQANTELNELPECYKIYINDAVAAGKTH